MAVLGKIRKFQVVRFFAGLIIVGLFMSVFGGLGIYKTMTTTYVTSEATVSRVEEVHGTSTEGDRTVEYTSYNTFISYEVDGVKYEDVALGELSEEYKVGDKIAFRYNVEDPSDTATEGGDYILFVVTAAGAAAVIAGIILLIKNAKKKSSDLEEYDKVDMSSFSSEEIEAVKNSTEEMREYIFHFDKHIKQGYILENEYKEPVYEARMLTMNPFKPFEFEFKNHLTGETKQVKIGHTVTYSIGAGSGFAGSLPIKSAFTVDGKNNWDYLAENGFGFNCTLEGIAPCFRVKHFGTEVAYIKTVGTNAIRDKESLIGKMPVNGIFSVKCRRSDIDMVFMVCVSIARAIFYEND